MKCVDLPGTFPHPSPLCSCNIQAVVDYLPSSFIFRRFYSCLVNNVTFKYKDVHAAAAEVIGLVLKNLAEEQKVKLCTMVKLYSRFQ